MPLASRSRYARLTSRSPPYSNASQDRIFTNLYNDQSPYLKAAMARGDWHKTKELVLMGPEQIIADMKASGLRGEPLPLS